MTVIEVGSEPVPVGRARAEVARVGAAGLVGMARTMPVIAGLEGVTKSYGAVTVLENLTLDIHKGEVFALLGHNGAGKTTTIRLLLGLTRPDRGSVRLFGLAPDDIRAKRRIGVMLQTAELSGTLRVRELIDLVSSYYPAPFQAAELVAMTSLGPLAAKPYARLSGGEKRLVQFALAVCGRPELIFLDEPSVGLDIEAREALWGSVRSLIRSGCSVVLTTHQLEEAEALADRVVVLNQGRIAAAGSVDSLRGQIARARVSALSSLDCSEVAQWPGVKEAVREAGRLVILTADGTRTARELLKADPEARHIEVKEGGLIDVLREHAPQRGAGA